MAPEWLRSGDEGFHELRKAVTLADMIVDSVNADFATNPQTIQLLNPDLGWASIRNNSSYTLEIEIAVETHQRKKKVSPSPWDSYERDFKVTGRSRNLQLLKPGESATFQVPKRTGWVKTKEAMGTKWYTEKAYKVYVNIVGFGSTLGVEPGVGETVEGYWDGYVSTMENMGIPYWLPIVAIIGVVILFIVLKK